MCGIVGIAGRLESAKIRSIITKMNRSIAHRGPDDEGVWTQDGFGFGMKRLNIIDLVTGHQPMWDEISGQGIVYNGEVYNYKALRAELEKEGICFHTSSDTEVVLKGLVNEYTNAVQTWNGMFALALWDKGKNRLTLIRDRLGVKPLYYYWDGENFIFASEIKAILSSELFKPKINQQAIWDYLTFRYVPGPDTMWENIYKVPPAHILCLTLGGEPELTCYWRTDVISNQQGISFEQKLKDFENLFLDSVELRLLASDVPVGVFLSGGLDSSVIAAAAVELGHKHFHSFSVGFEEGGDFSELGFARTMAKHVGAEYHEVVLNQESFLEMLPEAIRATDEPLADLTIVPLLALSHSARQWVKVVLSGEGSDELLGGYDFDVLMRRWKLITTIQTFPKPITRALLWPLILLSPRYALRVRNALDIPLAQLNSTIRMHMTKHLNQEDKIALWPSFNGLNSDRILDGLYSQSKSKLPLEQLLSVYQKSWLVEDLLMKADKMTMAASLELRVPFLDYRLVEWANCQTSELKVKNTGNFHFITKAILRHFAEKRLPKEILKRPKRGFPVPVYRWLQDDKFQQWVFSCILGPQSFLKSMFTEEALQKIIRLARRGDLQAAHRTWLFIVLAIWLKENKVNCEGN